ncbi:MAG TPA: FxLYD domain-containing protein [Nitrososphaeraceae archaeon]|nr:FxLYD domain-containing protein [Nitrososphaeraceae archaeon]
MKEKKSFKKYFFIFPILSAIVLSLISISIAESIILPGYASSLSSSSTSSFTINNTSQYVDEFGYFYVLGEISNDSEESLVNITLKAKFLDSDGRVLGEYYRNPEISVINPNEISPFEIIYLDPSTSEKVKNFTIATNFQTANTQDTKPESLFIESVNSRLDFTGFYYINGKIKNEGIKNANNVTVVATIYDKKGNVIGITKSVTEPFVIPSGQTAAFGLAVSSKSSTFKISDFSLKAYSNEYLSHTVTTKK